MTQVLILFIDSTYRTLKDRDHRAMAGLSMGGMRTFHVAFDHLELFSYIGGFSGASNPFAGVAGNFDTKRAYQRCVGGPGGLRKTSSLALDRRGY